jgi:predicted ATPase
MIAQASTRGRMAEMALRSVNLPDDIREAENYLDYYFNTAINYLGPLRDEPKPIYPLPASPDLIYVGLKGEYTAAVLDLYKYRYVDFIPPTQLSETESQAPAKPVSLQEAVTQWLQYLGVAESVWTNDQGKLGHELRVKTPGVSREHDLTHAGVGLSQVLPILVTCLLSVVDSVLLIEQPELHLHPSVQSRLGDFFLSMALLGKQCVIETHSEYLINRLRFRIARAPQGHPTEGLTKIYFVEKKGDSSVVREVNVNEYGSIQSWPEGFFDQSQSEAEEIIRAASDKRKAELSQAEHAKHND